MDQDVSTEADKIRQGFDLLHLRKFSELLETRDDLRHQAKIATMGGGSLLGYVGRYEDGSQITGKDIHTFYKMVCDELDRRVPVPYDSEDE